MSVPDIDWPGYNREAAVAEYKTTLTDDGEPFPMLKKLKIFRAIVVNLGIFVIGGYAMYLGGDPTLLGITVLLVAGAYNGLEYSDYTALIQAVKEVQAEAGNHDQED